MFGLTKRHQGLTDVQERGGWGPGRNGANCAGWPFRRRWWFPAEHIRQEQKSSPPLTKQALHEGQVSPCLTPSQTFLYCEGPRHHSPLHLLHSTLGSFLFLDLDQLFLTSESHAVGPSTHPFSNQPQGGNP